MRLNSVFLNTHLNNAYKHFVKPPVHNLLYGTVFLEPSDIHRPPLRKDRSVKTKLLSDKELAIVKKFGKVFTRQKIQMPVILPTRDTNSKLKVYEENFKLQGLIPANQKIVFVDISLEATTKNRIIVSRNPDGSLTEVSGQDRDRLNQIYFPLSQRKLRVPNMFNEKFLDEILIPENYQYILDRTCVQFEPDDENYHRVFGKIFDKISENAWKSDLGLEQLKNSRYFGIVILHFIVKNDLLPIIDFYLRKENLSGLIFLFKLYTIVHVNSQFSKSHNNSPVFKLLDSFKFEELDAGSNDVIEMVENFLKVEGKDSEGVKMVNETLLRYKDIKPKQRARS